VRATAVVREHEWKLALMLRGVTRLRAKYDADPAITADAVASDSLETERGRTTSWVRGLEALAAQFKDIDTARKHYQGMDELVG